jgi:methyl-accepting chemotaxis protein
MASIMREVTGTVHEITGFVSDIEEIGQEIILIALNARIKAEGTGKEGASLSVLAEEIGQLSNNAVQCAEIVTSTLTEIDSTTEILSGQVKSDDLLFGKKLTEMKNDMDNILGVLETMGAELYSLISQLQSQLTALTKEIEKVVGSINVHERTKSMADAVLRNLKKIFSEARALQPASSAFKEDLRRMADSYTMESERRIHKTIAERHDGKAEKTQSEVSADIVTNESEFGDNVDLF